MVFEKKLFHQRRRKINYTETFIIIWNVTELSGCPNIYQMRKMYPLFMNKEHYREFEKEPKHGHSYASQAR